MTDSAQISGDPPSRWLNSNFVSWIRTAPPRNVIMAAGLTFAVIVFLVLLVLPTSSNAAWTRGDIPYATSKIARGDDLARFSEAAGQPAIIMALTNSTNLKLNYPSICGPERYASWPRRHPGYFCNDRLNLSEANTLVPNQRLRILATRPAPIAAIAMLVANVPAHQRVAVLVDGSTQKNLDHAAAIALALQQHDALASIWVYDRDRMFEFIDSGRVTPFNARNQGLFGALTALSVQPIDRVVLVTNTIPVQLMAPERMQPIIGYCMSSACERYMQTLVQITHGTYIPNDKL